VAEAVEEHAERQLEGGKRYEIGGGEQAEVGRADAEIGGRLGAMTAFTTR
jgi:hypothetical protein